MAIITDTRVVYPVRMSTEAETRPGVTLLRSWINKSMKVEMSDGRVIIGIFLCTDRSGNVIIGSCNEYTSDPDKGVEEEGRILGLAMVPGHHITRMWVDQDSSVTEARARPASPQDTNTSDDSNTES